MYKNNAKQLKHIFLPTHPAKQLKLKQQLSFNFAFKWISLTETEGEKGMLLKKRRKKRKKTF